MPPPAVQPQFVNRLVERPGLVPKVFGAVQRGGAAGDVDQRGPGHVADAPAQGRQPVSLHADKRGVVEFGEAAVGAQQTEIRLGAD